MTNFAKPFQTGVPDYSRSLSDRHGDSTSAMAFFAELKKLIASDVKANLNYHPATDTTTIALDDDRQRIEIGLEAYKLIRSFIETSHPWAATKIKDVLLAQGPVIAGMRGVAPPSP